ncbi:PREDICTED: tetratricopeptide repeat protein 39B-like isoform X2 [Priapulus caudatus]|uniref:Tetratricopeptide repeat protein 39B-like isoform X2 n=1 Tax=Priapulus caudatus TaxID=37621 RepID=A0ABM1DPX0_PRICU|nr:PREDICTED: tetratricopeptide repeat protein 39B-like isoform X2 [Priapulus caudatus]
MILLSYHTVATYVLGTGDGDIELAESVLGPCLQDYPNAIKIFEDSMSLQIEWKQFHDLCYWELMWCHSFRCDWLQAYNYAEKLRMESRWSRATYAYQQAAFLLMQDDVSAETRQHVIDILADIPNLKQKVAGKSIPVEKFALRKARKFAMQGNRLVLPGLELIYIWNGFNIIGKTPALLEPLVQRVERTLVELDATKDENENYAEDFALCMLLKGMCLKGLKCTTQAENCFREAAACDKRIRYDHYIVPYSLVELGLLFMRDGRFEEAKRTLEQARGYYKHYSLESRLHFRIHSALAEVRQHVSPDHLKAEFKPAGYSPMHSGGSFPQPLTPPPEAVIGAGMASAIQPLTSDGAELDRLNCDTACEAIEKPI